MRAGLQRTLAIVLVAVALAIGFGARSRAESEPSTATATEGERVLVVGLTGKYPPFNFFDERGTLIGFDVDFARALCAELHRRCEFRTLQWDGILGALLAGRIDVVVGSMAITKERAASVRFSAPYYESGAQLFVGGRGRQPGEAGFAVGVTLGTTYEATFRERWPRAELRVYKGDVEALQDLATGRLDGIVTDRLVGAYMAKKFGVKLTAFGAPLYEEQMAIPTAPANAALLAEIDAAVARIRGSPRYAEMMATWFGAPEAQASPRYIEAVKLLLHGLVATLLVCAAGLGLGIAASLVAAAALIRGGWAARPLALFVDFIRATPFMVQLFAIYFGLPPLGLRLGAWTSAVLAIGLHSAGYLAEVIKTSYRSVPIGQHHAARALGLSRGEALRHVIAPQMLPSLFVPSLNTIVAMVKDSAIVSVIGVYELTLQAQELIAATFRPMTFYVAIALLYFLVTYPLLFAGRRLEGHFRARGLLHG